VVTKENRPKRRNIFVNRASVRIFRCKVGKQLQRSLAPILKVIIKITPKSATERTRFRGNIKKKGEGGSGAEKLGKTRKQKEKIVEKRRKTEEKRRKKEEKRRKKREKEEYSIDEECRPVYISRKENDRQNIGVRLVAADAAGERWPPFRLPGAGAGSTAANTRHRNRVRFTTTAGQASTASGALAVITCCADKTLRKSTVGMHAAAASQTIFIIRFAVLVERRR